MGKTFRKTKIPLREFKVTILKNPLINNQAIISMKNLPWPILKYQPTVEPLLQYLIELDPVVAFFPLMHKFSICE